MATNQIEYINANHIDTISTLNSYTEQQKNTLNHIIQILINNEADKHATIFRDPRRDLAMILVTVGSSLGDVGIIKWVYDNKYANTCDLIYRYHIEYLNGVGFSIEYPSSIDSDTEN